MTVKIRSQEKGYTEALNRKPFSEDHSFTYKTACLRVCLAGMA